MRHRRGFVVYILLIAGTALLARWLLTGSRGDGVAHGALRGHNVLLVTIDTLRTDRVGAYGGASGLTPTLDRLAAEGIRVSGARAQVPLTLPSHASLLTGRIPPNHGVRDNGTYRLDQAQPTIATALKDAGYRTAAFVGSFVLDARFGLGRGFDVYDDHYGERSRPGRTEVIERRADQVTTPALAWIRSGQGPWFAWVHVYDPHEPYAAPEPFASRHRPYDGEVAYADAALGRMLEQLVPAGRLERTLIIVTSDHGEGLGDHGERTHGLFAYDSTLRVPLIACSPGALPTGVLDENVGLVDLAPTVLDLLGVPGLDGADGRSFRSRLGGDTAPHHDGTYFEALNANLTRNWAPLRGLVADGLKLIDLPLPELYDLAKDPGETTNLYARRPADAQRLERMLDAVKSPRSPAPASAVDGETAARLRSLGYVVNQTPRPGRRFTAEDDPKRLVALDTAMDRAMDASGRGDYGAAAAALESVIATRPDLTLAYDRLAFVLRAAGRIEKAVGVLEKAANAGVADAPLLVSLGAALQESGRLDRAAAVLEAAVRMSPHDVEARNRLAMAYAQALRPSDAERLFLSALDIDATSSETLSNLGVFYLGTGRRDDALAVLRRAIEADPGAEGARNTLAVAYARGGDLARAVEEWQRVLRMRPDDADALYNAGTALVQLNRLEEAIPLLERFVAIAPPHYAADVARVREMITSARRSLTVPRP